VTATLLHARLLIANPISRTASNQTGGAERALSSAGASGFARTIVPKPEYADK